LLDRRALVSPAIHWGDGPKAGHLGERLGSLGGGYLERGPLVVAEGLDRFAQVFDQMKPIHNLDGLRGPMANALGGERTPVPTDDTDGRMLREPGRDALRRALGQQVQDPMILQIDEDRPVALPPPPRPLVHTDDVRSGGNGSWSRSHEPQQSRRAGPHPQAGPETCTSLTTEGDPIGDEELGESQGPSCPRSRDSGEAFCENLAWACRIITEKLAHAELPAHGVGTPRQVSYGPCIPAVHPRGPHVAERAGDADGYRGDVERDLGGRVVDVPSVQGQRRPIW
jgi:hypothetical protein